MVVPGWGFLVWDYVLLPKEAINTSTSTQGGNMSEESHRRTKGSHGNRKTKKQGRVRGREKEVGWEERIEQSKRDKRR